jgi:hypothetical protein
VLGKLKGTPGTYPQAAAPSFTASTYSAELFPDVLITQSIIITIEMSFTPTDLYGAQYKQGPRLTVPPRRPLPQETIPAHRQKVADSGQYGSQDFYFHTAAKKNECKSYKLHRNIRGRATPKNAQLRHKEPRDNQDWNFVFPPSVIDRQCNAAVVKELLDCDCRICGRFEVGDLNGDASLISGVEQDPEVRFSIAVLAYMGTSFAIRPLYRCGLGKNGFSLAARLGSVSLVEELFGPLNKEPKIPEFLQNKLDRPIQKLALDFSRFYEETRMLLRSPRLQVNMSTTELQGCNLPFLRESSLYPDELHRFPLLSTLDIHPEYRDDSIPVRRTSS